MNDDIQTLNHEDSIKYIIRYILNKNKSGFTTYWYDLYLPNVMRNWCTDYWQTESQLSQISPYFYNASWELCRMWILRPGIKKYWDQSTNDGSAGNGYSITPFWKKWLEESDLDNFIPTEPWRFSEMLEPFSILFGPGFHERSQQAIRCYWSHTYLACCVMCWAAAESILLNLAIAKDGDEEKILKEYRSSKGRYILENMIISQQKGNIKNDFEICFSLLKYWRDESAHWRKSNISENEAYTSLALLMRCAQFAKDNYQLLTGKQI